MSALDRDAARHMFLMHLWTGSPERDMDRLLDALEACVRPVPAQTIDRDALVAAQLATVVFTDTDGCRSIGVRDNEEAADIALALLRPVEGVREESIGNGTLKRVWAVKCDACNTWLSEWNSTPDEAEQILREHQDELHD